MGKNTDRCTGVTNPLSVEGIIQGYSCHEKAFVSSYLGIHWCNKIYHN